MTSTIGEFALSTPGCVRLFGDGQDSLGLSEIAMAIDLRMTITARPRDDDVLRIEMPDMDEADEIGLSADLPYRHSRDCVRSVLNVVRRNGVKIGRGYDFRVTSQIPTGAGVSGSSAFVILWTGALCRAGGILDRLSGAHIAQMGYAAEILEFREPDGMTPHYTCALGGLLHLDCSEPIQPTPIDFDLTGLVLGYSPEQTETKDRRPRSGQNTPDGIEALTRLVPGFDLKTTPSDDVVPCLREIPEEAALRFYACLRSRDLCQAAHEMMDTGRFDHDRLGEFLDEHHAMLRDYGQASTDSIEEMIVAAKSTGALGCKANSTHEGASMLAYAPGCESEVAKAIESVGGKARPVRRDDGIRLEAGTVSQG